MYFINPLDRMKKTLFVLSAFLLSYLVSGAQDKISVSFYAYSNLPVADRDKVTLEANESAGVGAFNTSGWNNYLTPWSPIAPQAPVTITSVQGNAATMILNDLRNGGPYRSDIAHTPPVPDNGNGDLMDGHCNATEDPGDGSNKFDMDVTNIPYNLYTLVVYIGANRDQFADGKGKIVVNDGVEQGFTLPAGRFSNFIEITNDTTPGNYIVFTKLRSSNLSLQVWGNGFNHIGPSGFQIIEDTSGVVPPGQASNPTPATNLLGLPSNVTLSWTAGVDGTTRNVYFGTDPSPDNSEFRGNQTGNTFNPGSLGNGTYFWRVDEVNGDGVTTGVVWSFQVGSPAKAFRPMPYDGMPLVATNAGVLKWEKGASATASSSQVYFGTDPTPDNTEFKGSVAGNTMSIGALTAGTTYYWRVDQVNGQGTMTGDVWSFKTPTSSNNKMKIFILAGQSNTEGQGEMLPLGTPGTLETIYANDTATYGHLKTGGSWRVRDDAWIWFKRQGTDLVKGGVSTGFGSNPARIGPELQFGHAMADHYNEKVLIIKVAWGGKSLGADFRPPSAGWNRDTPVSEGDQGFYYKQMLDLIVEAGSNIANDFPGYNPADGCELVGFGWHQGWNDRVTQAFSAEYESNMEKFIKDVRLSLGAPKLPFVIATSGMVDNGNFTQIELAQLQMKNFGDYPDFRDNVGVVDTKLFNFPVADSPRDEGFHWNRNAGSYYLIGDSMAGEMKTLLDMDTPFDIWAGANGINGGFSGDDDNDGVSNGLEWYFAGDQRQILNPVKTGSSVFEFTHLRPIDRRGVTDIYQWSNKLIGWFGGDGFSTDGANTVDMIEKSVIAGPEAGYETVAVEATVTGPQKVQMFFRVRVTKP